MNSYQIYQGLNVLATTYTHIYSQCGQNVGRKTIAFTSYFQSSISIHQEIARALRIQAQRGCRFSCINLPDSMQKLAERDFYFPFLACVRISEQLAKPTVACLLYDDSIDREVFVPCCVCCGAVISIIYYSLILNPCSLCPTPCSPLPIPSSLLPIHYSLLPTPPYSLLPISYLFSSDILYALLMTRCTLQRLLHTPCDLGLILDGKRTKRRSRFLQHSMLVIT